MYGQKASPVWWAGREVFLSMKKPPKIDTGLSRAKPVNLPKISAADVDLEHIVEGHRQGGKRVGSAKTLFPAEWSDAEVLAAVLDAYRVAKKVLTQGVRVKVHGVSHGMTVELWVNMDTKRVETAYPL